LPRCHNLIQLNVESLSLLKAKCQAYVNARQAVNFILGAPTSKSVVAGILPNRNLCPMADL